MAHILGKDNGYRVLRRILPATLRLTGAVPPDSLVGVAIDVVTTGPDPECDGIIELALQRFRINAYGELIETGRRRNWLEEPAVLIPTAIMQATGLTPAQLAGRSLSEGEATAIMLDADFVVAHGAEHHRPFVELRLPMAIGRPWACSRADMDWHKFGFRDATLSRLLAAMGWFYDVGRAGAGVDALLHLFTLPVVDGVTTIRCVLTAAYGPHWIVEASGVSEYAEDVLRHRGYRIDASSGIWRVLVTDNAVQEELTWGRLMLYGGQRYPEAHRISWFERFSER